MNSCNPAKLRGTDAPVPRRSTVASHLPFLVAGLVGCHGGENRTRQSAETPDAALAPPSTAASTRVTPRRPDVPEGTPNLLATVPSTVAVSSTVDNPHDFPEHLMDGRLDTAWNSKTGDLRPTIAFRVPVDAYVERVDLTVGFEKYGAGHDLFAENHRIRRLAVLRDGKKLREVTLDPNKRGWQAVPVDARGGDFRLEVLETVAGTRKDWNEVVVSELRVVGEPGTHRIAPGTPLRVAVGSLDDRPTDELPATESSSASPEPTLDAVCAAYLGSVEPLWKSMLADPQGGAGERRGEWKPPFCRPTPWSGTFAGDAFFRQARALRVGFGLTDEARLVVETPRGWVLTPVAWDDAGANLTGCPSVWVPKDVPAVKVESGHLVAFVDGESMTLVYPEPTSTDTGWRVLLQRGLTWCKDASGSLTCKTHDPQYDGALDMKSQPGSSSRVPWTSLRWSGGKSVHVERDGKLTIRLVKPTGR